VGKQKLTAKDLAVISFSSEVSKSLALKSNLVKVEGKFHPRIVRMAKD
jgi:hypothetical protein